MMRASILAAVLAAGPRSDAEEGVEAFAEGRYDDAARILERAYAATPEPPLLFAWAQAERYAGRCDVAVPLYRAYLDSAPPADVSALAREAITACGEDPDRAAEPEAAEPEATEPAATEPVVTEPAVPEPVDRRRPAATDAWGHALTWPGLAVSGVGAGLLGEAHRRKAAGERAPTEQAYREAMAGAPGLSRAGIALLAGGGALVVAGVIRFAVVAARGRGDGRPGPRDAARPWYRRAAIGAAGVVWTFELAPRRGRALR